MMDASRMRVHYPADLPVSERRDDIVAALRDHQVVVIAGETGSGKTTQVPKMVIEALADDGSMPRIAHTQPRRIAARAVAERLAEELGVPLGEGVGYRVRFTDRTRKDTAITVMTDGVLLASLRRDRLLEQYDAIIIDEAHERSLNIDFLLGYLAWLLPQRPNLRVIVTSATLDTARFSEHFGGAPVIEVSGRTYPVEVRYRPQVDVHGVEIDEVDAVTAAVDELLDDTEGDILVFLTGEREIRDARDALLERLDDRVDVLSLYGRLSADEQHRVFAPHDRRRVVLATNVAETSLTVPGIRSVVDAGTVRMSRFSTRLKVQRLPIEPISRASADQRAGRCGRLGPGVCIRLYSEEDLLGRPAYTDPEILRTNLASVLLQMATLGLGEIDDFPFLDPPDRRAVAAGIAILEEVGALQPVRPRGDGRTSGPSRLTSIGRSLARLPVDPRLGRMIVQAEREGCLDDIIVIAAGLAIRDPRERPDEQAGAADAAHARFIDPTSDLLTMLALWDYLEQEQGSMSSTRFRAQCRREFIHYLRVREWQDLVAQLRSVLRLPAAGRRSNRDADAIHRCVLAGFISHIGMHDPDDRAASSRRSRQPPYRGARDTRFALWPGSVLAKANHGKAAPRWVVAAELVDTGRLWGRMVARIDPKWIEPLAGALAQRSHSEPVWSPRQARARCVERVTVLGLPVVTDRRVPYDRIDPAEARRLFILHALVRDEWSHRHDVLRANAALLAEHRDRRTRARRADDERDEEVIAEFYDARLPETITSGRAFDAWWRRTRGTAPTLLDFPDGLLRDAPTEDDFPGVWEGGLPLTYRFAPGDPRDGVSVHVPVTMLPSIDDEAFAAHVRGYREDVVTALIRSLPKDVRRALGPASDIAPALTARMDVSDPRRSLSDAVRSLRDIVIDASAWDFGALPDHLRPTIVVEDAHGREIASGKDIAALRARCADLSAAALREAKPHLEMRGITSWPDVSLAPDSDAGSVAVPGLVVEGDGSVSLRVHPTTAARDAHHARGVAALLAQLEPLRIAELRLDDRVKLALGRNPHGSVAGLLADASSAVAHDLMDLAGGAPLTAAEFDGLRAEYRRRRSALMRGLLLEAMPAIERWWDLHERLSVVPPAQLAPAYDDMREHLADLTHGDFLTRNRQGGVTHLDRYLHALQRRLRSLPGDRARDAVRMEQMHRVEDAYLALEPAARFSPEGRGIRGDLAELRVSLWAQDLGTARSVSAQRLLDRIASCATGHPG